MNDQSLFRRSDKIKIREDNDGVYLVIDKEVKFITVINRTAGLILSKLDGKNTVGDIKRSLMQQFGFIPAEKISADVDKALNDFLKSGYIVFAEQAQVS